MFPDFKNAVLKAYAEKKERRQLSDNLLSPTKAKLRQECLSILKNRYDKKDDEVIKAFFNPDGKYENHEISISKFELDGFAALRNFLLGQPDIRREETIKLLAWLINFEPRPYSFDQTYGTTEAVEDAREIAIEEQEIIATGEEKHADKRLPPRLKKTWIYALIIGLFLIASIAYKLNGVGEKTQGAIASDAILLNEKKQIPLPYIKHTESNASNTNPSSKQKKECMYWNGNRYVVIYCDKDIGDTAKYVLNNQKVAKFRRISNPDTLTKNSIGKVYIVKINNTIEYFSDEGFHPIHTEKKLRKLSSYMLDKYILNKR